MNMLAKYSIRLFLLILSAGNNLAQTSKADSIKVLIPAQQGTTLVNSLTQDDLGIINFQQVSII